MREPVLQSTPVFPVGFMHYQSPLFSGSQATKTPGRHILGGFSIKGVVGTAVSSCYGCSLAIANPPILPQHTFYFVHLDIRHYNDQVTRLPKVTPKPVNVISIQEFRVFEKDMHFLFHGLNCTARLFSLSQYGTFIIAKRRIWICFTAVRRVEKRG